MKIIKSFQDSAKALIMFCAAIAAMYVPQAAYSQDKPFFCGTSYNERIGTRVPTTIARTARGPIPLAQWTSEWATDSGYNPTRRCQEVTDRFNQSYASGVLRYIRTGLVNNLPVICTASVRGGMCPSSTVLITLKKGSDSEAVLKQLLSLRRKVAGKPLEFNSDLYSYKDESAYVNVEVFLNVADTDKSSMVDGDQGSVFYKQ